jgi:hypothetical protein
MQEPPVEILIRLKLEYCEEMPVRSVKHTRDIDVAPSAPITAAR